jgi:2-methylfumaryl-CoA isomerase
VLFERYRTFAQVAEDQRVTSNPLFSRLHQEGIGEYFAPGMLTAFDDKHPSSGPAPVLGGDTVDVLTERLGLSAADIERLSSAKAIAG